jgi:3-methylcrotonyl-CoA carboxylase alpha subunit
MFSKILIANRGEIACRVVRTARRLGIRTVAVHSDADARALHVRLADEAVAIGPAPAADSYLRGDRIIEAALRTGAEAIHPGYGFLSENPDFVEQVEAAGLVFIGPSADAIRAMGLKDAAKRLMEKAGVPVVPGYHGDGQALVLLATKAREIGYPVLIKARAGGGGKGMRRVDDPDRFADALSAARREAKAAFGDDAVLVEKFVAAPRHIEVQVFGDRYGNVVHLFERDCSAQRRHQKVLEEAPAPGMTDEMRSAMTSAAVTAARAVGYSGAGTVEFIVDGSDGLRPDRFWFMEMNTRLQVEHPVTEMVTGIDLVEWQLRVAAGETLPLAQDQIRLSGHAVEARLYAEDPARGFLPQTGRLHHLDFARDRPTVHGATIRIDSGVAAGDAITPYYDPMIAKLLAHAPDRPGTLAALGTALASTEVAGATTNLAFLAALVADEDFAAARLDTGLIERRQAFLTIRPEVPPAAAIARAALTVAGETRATGSTRDPWDTLAGYAHHHPILQHVHLRHGDEAIAVRLTVADGALAVEVGGVLFTTAEAAPRFARWPGHVTVFDGSTGHDFAISDPLDRDPVAAAGGSVLRAPMPGLVKLVRVAAGEKVSAGQALLVLEAMKMEHVVAAARDGVVAEVMRENAQVEDGAVLVRFAEEA